MSEESKITLKDGTVIKITGGEEKKNASISVYEGDYKNKDDHSAIHININTETGKGNIVEHGPNHTNKEKTDIDELIGELAKPYIEMANLAEKKIILNLQYNGEISIDTSKIYQVLVILLDNAIKYTEKGDTIELLTYSKDGKFTLEVRDTGIGISDEAITHIFDRFYREDKARNRETGGSGLGLSIADVIVKAHNGTIKASHNKPKGTVFTIKLPK